jgi:hypothetical protein
MNHGFLRPSGGAEAVRVRSEVDPPCEDAGLELRCSVTAAAETLRTAGKAEPWPISAERHGTGRSADAGPSPRPSTFACRRFVARFKTE